MKIHTFTHVACLALLCLLCLFSPLLTSCVGTGISLGAGSGGVGVGVHSGYYHPDYGYGAGWPGLALGYGRAFGGRRHWGNRHYAGVAVGVPVTRGPGIPVGYADHPVGEVYRESRVVAGSQPLADKPPITEASHADWKRYDNLYHSVLPYYRGKSFMSKK